MALSSDLISQFVKVTNDEKKIATEATVYGETVKVGDKIYVKLDGSDQLTPVNTTTDVEEGDRVSVMIKDHSATITGNMSSPAARTDDVQEIGKNVTEFEIILADKVSTKQLEAEVARIDKMVSDEIEAVDIKVDNLDTKVAEIDKAIIGEAEIENLVVNTVDAKVAEIDFVTTEQLDATNAKINNLDATYATVTRLEAAEAEIDKIETEKLDADFGNFQATETTIANVGKLYVDTALVKEFVGENGVITKELDAVTVNADSIKGGSISADLIRGGTITADKLVIKDENGLYYSLNIAAGEVVSEELTEEEYEAEVKKLQNGLSGKTIIAESITADKIRVSDLAAFNATIGGFVISGSETGENEETIPGAIHSFAKDSVNNALPGIYLGDDGQISIGDSKNYIKYHKIGVDEEGNAVWKMEVAFSSLTLALNDDGSDRTEELVDLLDFIKVEKYNNKPSMVLSEVGSNDVTRITNIEIKLTDGVSDGTAISANGVETGNVTLRGDIKQGGFIWKRRQNGNIHKLGLTWEGVDG